MRTCKRCKEEKQEKFFYVKDKEQRRDSTCSKCRIAARRERRAKAKAKAASEVKASGRDITKCNRKKCLNPRNGSLTASDYHAANTAYVKRDGTQTIKVARICKVCKSAIDKEAYERKKFQLQNKIAIENLKRKRLKELKVDWSEFANLPWDVKAANNYIRGAL